MGAEESQCSAHDIKFGLSWTMQISQRLSQALSLTCCGECKYAFKATFHPEIKRRRAFRREGILLRVFSKVTIAQQVMMVH